MVVGLFSVWVVLVVHFLQVVALSKGGRLVKLHLFGCSELVTPPHEPGIARASFKTFICSDHSENHFWPEFGRRLSSGPATTGNRYQVAVRIQWTTSRPSQSDFFVDIRPEMKVCTFFLAVRAILGKLVL